MGAGVIETFLVIPRLLLAGAIIVFLILFVPVMLQPTEAEREWQEKFEFRQKLQVWTQNEFNIWLPRWAPNITNVQVQSVNPNNIAGRDSDRIWADEMGIQDTNIQVYDCHCTMTLNGQTYPVIIFVFTYYPYTPLNRCGVLIVGQSAQILFKRMP